LIFVFVSSTRFSVPAHKKVKIAKIHHLPFFYFFLSFLFNHAEACTTNNKSFLPASNA